MATPFSNKCDILGSLWISYRYDSEFEEFIRYNDIGLPLAYFVATGMINDLSDRGKQMIEDSWVLFSEALQLSDDVEYKRLDEIFESLDEKDFEKK